MTGLEVPDEKFTVASGLQCKAESATATILFKEGFNSAFTDMDELVFNLRGVPESVTVTASMMGTGMPLDPPADADCDPTSWRTRRFSPTQVDDRGYERR